MKRPGSEHRSHITLFSLVNLWKLSVLPPTIKSGATKLRMRQVSWQSLKQPTKALKSFENQGFR